jgi:hypothetical protein
MPYIQTISKYLKSDKLIIAKKDVHAKGIGVILRKITRIARQLLFPDIIKIN